MRKALPAKIRAVNRANAYVTELYETLAPVFKPLVGTKIEKADGSLLKKVEDLLPDLPGSVALHVYRQSSNYALAWVVKTCENLDDGSSCVYHERTVYVGSVKEGVLTELSEPPTGHRSDYTVEEIQKLQETYQAAKRAAEEARNAMYPFGEYA